MHENKWWHPQEFQKRRANLLLRNSLQRALEDFFLAEAFTQVTTPCLQYSPGMEPHLTAFSTSLENSSGKKMRELFLHTSPEFAMKKLLVAGAGNIFQFAPTFRNREGSSTHHPEFTMLEWYRVGCDYRRLMQDCEKILRRAAALAPRKKFSWQGNLSDPEGDWQYLRVSESFALYAKINLEDSLGDGLHPDRDSLARSAVEIGINIGAIDSWEDIFFRIFLEKIEPLLGIGSPTILYDYPACMAALSRRKSEDARFAERFEVYVCGLELANAFSELTDAKEQRARFHADMEKKESLYGFRYPIDEDFIAALEFGLPCSAGIALGMDRLAMLTCGAERIEDVLWAPVTC